MTVQDERKGDSGSKCKDWEDSDTNGELDGNRRAESVIDSGVKKNMIKSWEYLKNIPDALTEGAYEYLMKVRKERQKNIMIRKIRTVSMGCKEEVREVIKNI